MRRLVDRIGNWCVVTEDADEMHVYPTYAIETLPRNQSTEHEIDSDYITIGHD